MKVQYYMAGISLHGNIIENSITSSEQEELSKVLFPPAFKCLSEPQTAN